MDFCNDVTNLESHFREAGQNNEGEWLESALGPFLLLLLFPFMLSNFSRNASFARLLFFEYISFGAHLAFALF